jgi:cell shape-determining protein MreC
MTMFDGRRFAARAASPGGALALVSCVALVVFSAPQRFVAPLRTLQREISRPGLEIAIGCRRWASETAGHLTAARAAADELAACRAEVGQLRRRSDQLQIALDLALAREDREPADQRVSQGPTLVVAEGLRARVLGRQARAHLAQSDVIAAGGTAGVVGGTLVLDEPLATLDQGRDAGLVPGQLAIAGGRIWGRVVEVGPWTSVVGRANQPGYRDLVQLARRDEHGLRPGPRGVLEGNGEPFCRIRRIETTAAVSVGDLVIAAGEQGLAETPLVYGRVARVEQTVGGHNWEIWMTPAAARDAPDELTVVRTRLSAARLAQTIEEADRK